MKKMSSVGDEVTLSVETVPRHGRLLLVDNAETTPLTSTSLNELLDGHVRVVYRHDGSHSHSDHFTLALSQGRHVATTACHVTVQLTNHDARPVMTTNTVVRVQVGGSAIITADNLRATDDQVPPHLYKLTCTHLY